MSNGHHVLTLEVRCHKQRAQDLAAAFKAMAMAHGATVEALLFDPPLVPEDDGGLGLELAMLRLADSLGRLAAEMRAGRKTRHPDDHVVDAMLDGRVEGVEIRYDKDTPMSAFADPRMRPGDVAFVAPGPEPGDQPQVAVLADLAALQPGEELEARLGGPGLQLAREIVAGEGGGSKEVGATRLRALSHLMRDGVGRTGAEVAALLGLSENAGTRLMRNALDAGSVEVLGNRRSLTDRRRGGRRAMVYRAVMGASVGAIAEVAAAEPEADVMSPESLERRRREKVDPPARSPVQGMADAIVAAEDRDARRRLKVDAPPKAKGGDQYDAQDNQALEQMCTDRGIDLDPLRMDADGDQQEPPRGAMLELLREPRASREIPLMEPSAPPRQKKVGQAAGPAEQGPRPGLVDQCRRALEQANGDGVDPHALARSLWVNWQEVDQAMRAVPGAAKREGRWTDADRG